MSEKAAWRIFLTLVLLILLTYVFAGGFAKGQEDMCRQLGGSPNGSICVKGK